jgi:hypothetical protein
MNDVSHILKKTGILTSFTIAKKISEKDIMSMMEEIKKENITSTEKINIRLREKVIEKSNESTELNNIPGLLNSPNESFEGNLKLNKCRNFANNICKEIKDNGVDNYHICFIINVLINELKLTEIDFEKFNERFEKFRNGETDSDEEQPIY